METCHTHFPLTHNGDLLVKLKFRLIDKHIYSIFGKFDVISCRIINNEYTIQLSVRVSCHINVLPIIFEVKWEEQTETVAFEVKTVQQHLFKMTKPNIFYLA